MLFITFIILKESQNFPEIKISLTYQITDLEFYISNFQSKVTFSWHACCVWFSSFANWPEFDLLHSCVALMNEWYLAASETREGNTTSQFVFAEFFALKEKNLLYQPTPNMIQAGNYDKVELFLLYRDFLIYCHECNYMGFDFILFIISKYH